MIKSYITFITILFALTACDRGLQFSNSDTSKPGVYCVVEPEEFQTPAIVQQGVPFTMSYNRFEVEWRLSDGLTDLTFKGSPIEISLNTIGTFSGTVYGKNNCNKPESREFTLRVVEKVEGLKITINNDALYTRDQNVELGLLADGASDMYVTQDSTCSTGGTWEPYTTSKAWTLGEVNKLTSVYVKFRNSLVETSCMSDDITHDNLAPTVQFSKTPAALTNITTAEFEIDAKDSGSGLKNIFCKLDSATYQPCSAQLQLLSLSQGSHVLSVYADDNAGNVSSEIQHTWVVDSLAPTVRITQAPQNPTKEISARFVFEGSDNGTPISEFECSLDGSVFQACTTPKVYTVAHGSHVFRVKGKDSAGNFSAEASHSWVVDSVAPSVRITQAPQSPTKLTSAHFEFTVQDSGLGIQSVECQLDSSAPVSCSVAADYAGLSNGAHTFRVVATDKVGNIGSDTHVWIVNDKITDQVIPVVDSGGATDILFMMDTTDSMYDIYANNIQLQFRNFLNVIKKVDYKIGVVTSDYREGASLYREGRIVPIEKGNRLTDEFVITPTTSNLLDRFLDTLARREVICTHGTWTGPNGSFCGRSGWNNPVSTQIIKAGLKSFDHPDNQHFFRSGSSLNVVVVSDSNEVCSEGMMGPNGICLPQDTEHSPDEFLSKIQTVFPGKSVKVHALVHRPGDTGCDMGPSNVGSAYIHLANQTGGVVRSVCKKTSSEGNAIAGSIMSASQQSFQLVCDPDDANGDGIINEQDITWTLNPVQNPKPQMTLSGRSIQFSPNLPTGIQIQLKYVCQ